MKLFEEIKAGKYEAYTAIYVTDELIKADEPKRSNMRNLIAEYNIIVLPADDEAERLADTYIKEGTFMIPIAKPFLGEEEKAAVAAVLDSGMIASGAVVSEFEQAFASYIGMPEGVACTSGTTALELALRALGIGRGDKVLTTAFSFIASANSILYVGAAPVFSDIDVSSFLITPEHILSVLDKTPDVKAILLVHLFGQTCDMDAILAIAKERGLMVIEDCAQSHGASFRGKTAGSFADASCFSFYPTKNMTTSEGGMALFRSAGAAETARLLINHGMKVRYEHELLGYNYRMTNIAAAIGLAQLKKLPFFNQQRQRNAAWLTQHITNPLIQTPLVSPGCEHVFHQYTVKTRRRADFLQHLQANEIGYGIFYPLTIPEQRCYEPMGFPAVYPSADTIKEEVVSLPVHPQLSADELNDIARVVNQFR